MNIEFKFNKKFLPLLITIGLFVFMFVLGSVLYDNFFSLQVFLNLFIDNAFLCITAIGMTFVILSGGIDLSVGSIIALTTMVSAFLLEKFGMSPAVVIPAVLLMGAVFGFSMGSIIHFFKTSPFIVTLAGMFLARGLCYVISIDTIKITNSFYKTISEFQIKFSFSETANFIISVNVIILLVIIIIALIIAHLTKFGRTVYAIGGNEQSALLMGLPVGRTKIMIYTINGFLSSVAGVVFSFYMLSGYGLHALGMELDAIASVVIGGTLLSGGVGYMLGTVFGVLILGIIQTLIMFQGNLSSWWTKIVIGFLVFVFILIQRIFKLEGDVKKD